MQPARQPSPSALDTFVYHSPDVTIGRFRCGTSHPHFRDTGPIREAVVVFPQTSVWIRHEGARPFVADANVVTIYNRGQRYERFPIDPAGDRCVWYALAEPLAREVTQRLAPSLGDSSRGPFPFERASNTPSLYTRQRALFRRAAAGSLSTLEAEEEVLSIVFDVLARAHGDNDPRRVARQRPVNAYRQRNGSRRRDLAEAARAVLARTAIENRSVGELANILGTSPFHLCRVFKEETGQTMHEYRVGLRLRLAIEQLCTTDGARARTFSEVANAVGFASHAHFVRICQRALGMAPAELRRKLRASSVSELETVPLMR